MKQEEKLAAQVQVVKDCQRKAAEVCEIEVDSLTRSIGIACPQKTLSRWKKS